MGAQKLDHTQAVSLTAFMADNTVTVNFNSSITDAYILITNIRTGEVVHHEVFSSRRATSLCIQLDDCYAGAYQVIITSPTCEYSREFSLN